ncbi:MAG: ParB/RepB/Spo0J family partition protein, partial [Deltaproteobacteria bacterium]
MAKKTPKATGDCATCPFWKMRNSRIKGKLIPGGTGKCTRPEGLCDNPKPKDPIKGAAKAAQKERGLPTQAPETAPQDSSKTSNEVNLSLIYPNPSQPRKFFPREALEELALSIKEQGLIEPLVVAPREGKFMLIAGERRWRACQMAGIEKVPVRILQADDRQIAEMALVENIQRQDLTPLEEARAFQAMLDSGYTKEELARKLGFKQVWRVDKRLSLLNLAPKYQEAMVHGIISPSQAFEMSRLTAPEEQELVFQKVKAGELPTYNHIRRFVNALVDAKKQTALFALPKKEDLEVVSRWEKALDAVTGLVCKSFALEDCRVLAKVYQGNTLVNLAKIDLIIKHLNLVKKAMLENASRQEVVRLAQGGDCEA